VKQRLKGEAYLVRYIDDFVLCFQYRQDALRVQEVLRKRLAKFGLTLEPKKPNWLNLTALHTSMPAREGVIVKKRSTFWALLSTVLET
jgi:hypothetical protein